MTSMPLTPAELKERLLETLRSLESVAVAFSGGVDSATLLKAAREALGPERCLGVTVCGDIFPSYEVDRARRIAREHCLPHVVLQASPMELSEFVNNPPERCYHCKRFLFDRLITFVIERGFTHLCDGTNADDVGDHRPGLRALKELRVRSPFKELGVGKAAIREMAREWGLENWDAPSAACLASRIPYGQIITGEKLARIDAAETFLRDRCGLRVVRVRHDGATARVETAPEDIPRLAAPETRELIVARLRELGFQYVALDLAGYRTGSLNEVL